MALESGRFQLWANELVQTPEWAELLKTMKLEVFAKWVSEQNPHEREELHRRILTIGQMENIVKAAADDVKMDKSKGR